MITAALLGVLIGVHVATWGAYKDLPFEGFRLVSYLRSVALAVGCGLLAAAVLPMAQRPSGLLVVLGVVYAMERLATEWWKSILREEAQDKYTIPMRLALRGRPIQRRATRYLAGALIAALLIAASWQLMTAQQRFATAPAWLVTVVVGGLGGWATAVGGAWKDAPIEGFSPWKFLRSPAVATAWAVPLSLLTTDWLALCLGSAGYAVASIETYKTFLTGGRPPGKFDGQPIRHHRPVFRRRLAAVHAALWAALAMELAGGLAEPARGLSAATIAAVHRQLPSVVLAAVIMVASGLATLVVDRSRLSPAAA